MSAPKISCILSGLYDFDQLSVEMLDSELNLKGELARCAGTLRVDSREVEMGDTFVAVPGAVGDGRNYISAAIENGCTFILCESEHATLSVIGGVTQLALPNVAENLSAIAARFYQLLDGDGVSVMPIRHIGITGTNGKTTCSQWLTQLLDMLGADAATIGTLGYGRAGQEVATGFTTPDAIGFQHLLAELSGLGVNHVVSEVSSHGLVQGRVAAVPFNMAIFTNIGRDHLDYHGTMKAYVEAKTRLMAWSSLEAAVINIDDVYAGKFIYALGRHVKPVSYSLNNTEADFYCSSVSADAEGVALTLCSPQGSFSVRVPVWGEFNIYNLLAVTAAAHALGYGVEDVVTKLPQLNSVPGRMEPVEAGSCVPVFVDFAHTADALKAALSSLAQHTEGQLWCVFGCGGNRDKGKRPLMASTAEAHADHVILTSDNPRDEKPESIAADVMVGFGKPDLITVELDRAKAIEVAIGRAKSSDCILIAGKGHEKYQLIAGESRPFSDMAIAQAALLKRKDLVGVAV